MHATHPHHARAVAIIPARLGSTRFPGKVLAADTGWPLIRHVWESARRARTLSRVLVATDDARVLDACRGFGAEAVLTRADHANGTSRLAEAADALGLPDASLVVNVQGDEPDLEPPIIDAAVHAIESSHADAATVASPFQPGEDPADPNLVKAVLRQDGTAMYFSRALVPHRRDRGAPVHAEPLRHVGLYVYRAGFLRRYVTLAPTPLEQTEMLEQLRVLEHGYSMAVAVRPCRAGGIDTPEQYAAFVARWRAAHPA
jgi:3-deoxy-manno-octulosonate cytidylyltransferase (CMP-KDO synthetase)